MGRDDFSQNVKNILCDRVAGKCSNPNCRCDTIGPHSISTKRLSKGQAAHITAASAGGPRYNPDLTPEQRADIANGIWLCDSCATMIDNDPDRYPVQQLLLWKHQAEYEQYCNVNGITVSDNSMLHQELMRRKLEACRNLKSALERLHQRLCYAYEYWRGNFKRCDNLEAELMNHYQLYEDGLIEIRVYIEERNKVFEILSEYSLDISNELSTTVKEYCDLTYFRYQSDNCGFYDNYWASFFVMISQSYKKLCSLKSQIDELLKNEYNLN